MSLGSVALHVALLTGGVSVAPAPGAFDAAVSNAVPGHPGNQGATQPSSPVPGGSAAAAPTAAPGTWETGQMCAIGGAQTCAVPAYCADGSVQMEAKHTLPNGTVDVDRFYCASGPPPDATPAGPAAPTPDQIYSALKTVTLPEAVLHFQPVDNQTLVHFKSNYFTDGAPFDAAVDLPVGPVTFHVDFKIAPTEFDWTFGDGTTLKTSTPGAPYPRLEVTHEYAKAGTEHAHVDTVYGAEYRVNGGAWAPVDGTVTKHGADVTITVRQATPVLTD